MYHDAKPDTKQKIALALRQLMQERPLRKITVHDLMVRAQMTRQSFYYHFQDIQEVLVWSCEQQLSLPLHQAQELTFEEWMIQALNILYDDRNFYRQILGFVDQGFLLRFCKSLLRPRISQVMFQREGDLDEDQEFVIEVVVRAVLSYLPDTLASRRELDLKQAQVRLHYLLDALSLKGDLRLVV